MIEQIDTIQDLIRILATHPEWRAQLRPLILTDDFLSLPEQVRALADRIAELAAAQARTEHHLSALATAQARSEQRLSKVEDTLERTENRLSKVEDILAQLATAQARSEQRLSRVEDTLERTENRLSKVEDILAQLSAAQARSEQRLSRVEESLEQLAAAQARTERLVEQLAAAQTRTEQRLGKVENDVAILKGDVLELQSGKRVVFAYGRWLRRSRILSHEQVYELLDDAVDAGYLTMDERDQIAQADVFVQGKDKETGEAVHMVVEVSWGVGTSDVERAAARAALLAKIGTPTRAAVVGRVIVPEAEEKARALRVWAWCPERQEGKVT